MAIITIAMIYFPFVIVGLGQAFIAGTLPAGRVFRATANARVWSNTHTALSAGRNIQSDGVDKRAIARLPQSSRRPVASLPHI
jgi:hypothetical protein